jgi:hypothetical protein
VVPGPRAGAVAGGRFTLRHRAKGIAQEDAAGRTVSPGAKGASDVLQARARAEAAA